MRHAPIGFSDDILSLTLTETAEHVLYRLLGRFGHCDFEYALLRLPYQDIALTADVDDILQMLTTPRHLIPPLVYVYPGSMFVHLSILHCLWELCD